MRARSSRGKRVSRAVQRTHAPRLRPPAFPPVVGDIVYPLRNAPASASNPDSGLLVCQEDAGGLGAARQRRSNTWLFVFNGAMSKIKINKSNKAKRGTELFARPSFGQDYVFQANATHDLNPHAAIDGLHGLGTGRGRGVVGVGGSSPAAVVSDTNEFAAAAEGVVGFGGDTDSDEANTGVLGMGGNVTGLAAASGTGGPGVCGIGGQPNGPGVVGYGTRTRLVPGGAGVVGVGTTNSGTPAGRGGEFRSGNFSGEFKPPDSATTQGVAQIRLIPSAESTFPTEAHMGDLWAHAFVDSNMNPSISLWLCVREDNDGTKRWSQIVTSDLHAGGDAVPPGS
jgi:hypothetical protein